MKIMKCLDLKQTRSVNNQTGRILVHNWIFKPKGVLEKSLTFTIPYLTIDCNLINNLCVGLSTDSILWSFLSGACHLIITESFKGWYSFFFSLSLMNKLSFSDFTEVPFVFCFCPGWNCALYLDLLALKRK